MNTTSKQLLEKIRYLHPNLKPDDQLTKHAHELTTLIRDRKITSPNQAEKWIQNQDFIPDNLKKIITVYNSNNSSLTPIEYFFTKTGYNEISQDALLNRIGVSVRPLKSKKVIFVVLFAEIDESAANNKINTIITKFTGKVPNWDPNIYDESIGLLFQLINSFRSNFNLPRLSIEKEFCDNVISNDESEFIELKVCLQKNRDILLSCLMNPSFVQFIFSSINSIAAKADDTSDELKIAFQARKIMESKNQNNESIENASNELVMKDESIESRNDNSVDSDLTRETDQIKLLPAETEQPIEHPKEENQSKDNEITNELDQAEDKKTSAGNEEDFVNIPQQQPLENEQAKDDTKPSTENEDDLSKQQDKVNQMEEQNPADNEGYQESRNPELNDEKQENITDQKQKNEVGHQNEVQNSVTEISNEQETKTTEKEQKTENDLQNDQQAENKEENLTNQHQQEVEQKTETENVQHDESNLPTSDQQTENKEDNLTNQFQQEIEQKTDASQPQKSEEEIQQQSTSSPETDHQKEEENTIDQSQNEKLQEISKEEPVSSNSAQNEQNSQESSQEIQERHIKINKVPNVKSATKKTLELDLTDSKESILTTPKKQTKQISGNLLDENDLVNTKISPAINNEKIDRPNSNTNDNKEETQQNDVDNSQQNASNDNSSNNAEPVPIDLDSPCCDPSDLVARSIQVFNKENFTTVHDPPIEEMCERLRLFMQEHKDDFKKTVTNQSVRDLFNDDKEYKRGFVIYNKNWNQIRAEIEKSTRKYRKIPQSMEQIIYAVASTVNSNSTSNSEPNFNLCYVTRSTGVVASSIKSVNQSNLTRTPDSKSATQSQKAGSSTPFKEIVSGSGKNLAQTPDVTKKQQQNSSSVTATSIPSRYKEASQKLEYEIANELRKIKKGKSIQTNAEISDRIRKELIANKGKNWTNSDFHDMISNELNYPWARVYFNMGYEDLLKKARNEYKNHFPQKLAMATILSVAAIAEDESTNTYTAVVVTGQNKTNNNDNHNNNVNNINQNNNDNNNVNNNNNNAESTSNANLGGSKSSIVLPNLNLFDNKGSATNSNASFNSSGNQSSNQSASQSANATPRGTPTRKRKTRNINDNERSRLFLDCFNEYRQSIGKPLLELNDALIQPAKDYSRTIMQEFFVSDAEPFIKQANEIPGVENIYACAAFDSKSNDYVTRTFEKMLKQSKEAVESDNDKIAIGYWNDRDKNVAVACFLFRFVKQ